MIEGLRSLPWLQERIRNERPSVEFLIDCEKCMSRTNQVVRQSIGCGYEPPHERVRATPWTHQGYSDATPTTCPGFTTKLPIVVEINRARLHWNKGAIREFCGGEPTEPLQRGIEILEGAANEANTWRPDDR